MERDESAIEALSAETIRAWQHGEESAVRAVFDTYYPRAVRLGALSGLTLDEAQDGAQDAIVRAFEQRRQLRDPQAFSLWFHRIATRRILDMLRLGRHTHEVELDAAADLPEDWQRRQPPQPDEQALLAELREALWNEVQALPPRARIALALRYYGGFSLRDIAAMLSVREGALRVTVHRALAHLRQRITSNAALTEPQATHCDAPADATSASASHASN